jgi:hypothetical protein
MAGCVAETVRKNPPRLGPVKAVGYVDMGGGEVRYSADGWKWFVAGRRRAAGTLMRHVCGKLRPVVTEEFTQEDADVPYSQEDISVTIQLGAEHFTLAPYTHLVYECAYSSTEPVRALPPQALPPPPRPTAPLVEVFAADYSSASATTGVFVGTAAAAAISSAAATAVGGPAAIPAVVVSSIPVAAAVVTFSSAPATPALRAPPAPAPPRPAALGAPAAAWIAFPAGWTPAPAPPTPRLQTSPSPAAPAAVGTSSVAPSAVPSGVNHP